MHGAILVRRGSGERFRFHGIVHGDRFARFDRFEGDRFRCGDFRGGGGGLDDLVDGGELIMRGIQVLDGR